MKTKLIAFYLEYVNDFLTVTRFAEYHSIKEADCIQLIDLGKKYHELSVIENNKTAQFIIDQEDVYFDNFCNENNI